MSSGQLADKSAVRASYWELFSVFAKVGAFTLGGGYAMIPIISREVVQKRRWLGEEEFMDILTIAQSAPGLLAVNISIFVGYKLRGNKGSVVCTLGGCLPSFLIILLIAMFFAGFRENVYVDKVFKGVRPVVVALIAVPVVDMVRKANLNIYRLLLAVATTTLILWLRVSPIYILFVVGIFFFALRYGQQRERHKKNGRDEMP